jgi:Tol biopolymer transport system component
MPVAVGTRLGPYEIVAPIGAGGMGEVYKARDTRLGRDVALKVLPSAAILDPDRLRRFEQEARAAAALNHPNILVVHDVGTESGIPFVVSELLEGDTLRERLKAGALPLRKAIDYAAQVARGLAAAHDKGIVHRDLKPENVFVTGDGRVKILDFGLAKLTAPEIGAAQQQTMAPTLDPGTTPGLVLGTVGYMSPEQVRGAATDHRSDIFSFGAILYEMLAGRRAFAGATHVDTMSAILNADVPELTDATGAIPPILDRLVRRCLEKTPGERFESARDIAFNLDALSTTSHTADGAQRVGVPASRRRQSTLGLAAAAILGLVAGAAAMWIITRSNRPTAAETKFQQVTFRRGTVTAARFSPDGETIVYSATWEGRPAELYSARAGAIGERPLGIAGLLLAISKNGEMAVLRDIHTLGNWMAAGTLARSPLAGGAPRDILRDIGGADWSPDGQQLAITRFLPAERRWRLEYPIGTVLYETGTWIDRPRVSRDGTKILLLEHPISGDDRGRVIMITTARQRTEITPEYSSLTGVTWTSNDEVWLTASASGMRHEIFAVRPGGPVRRVAPMPAGVVAEDVLASGRVLLQTYAGKARMLVKTPADTEERDISWFDYALLRDISADGGTVLFDEEGEGGGPGYSVFVRRTDGSPAVRLGAGYAGRLSPDGQWASTASPLKPPNTMSLVPIGPGEPKHFVVPLEVSGIPRWFPDGKRLAVIGREPGRPYRTYEYVLDGGKVRALTPDGVIGTLVSNDGRELIAAAAGRGAMVWPLEGGTPREIPGLAATDAVLRWSADGRSLFIARARTVSTREVSRLDLATGRRQVLFTAGPSDGAGVGNVSNPVLSADGRTYAYRYNQLLSDLFVADGLR